ncbi:DUF2513 domain-containing protein [Ectopseudomonas hydrolytica]|uniref:DUF2513 domain-containing protein n=2 Tax=Ectopseudomonas TaxID=3236654 RepID=A0A1H0XAA1_9GAMM|nr:MULTISPECIES: DUF2513 domain-containing protein [Pseudomonas]USR38032.1 DUF2513 domain-containing protein [Pseudomonas hydrolytica]SDP99874.1 Hypothetical protein SAMN05216213_111105 [Pseudomonas guguanensis]
MKRDMDLIRKIVLAVETAPRQELSDVDQQAFNYHANLLIEAGLAEGAVGPLQRGIPAMIVLWRLTWNGHDFADSIKDDTIWNKARENVFKPTASWSFGVLLTYLKAEIIRNIPGI